MRKVLTLLVLLSLFVGIAGAANVTISKTPTFNWGPSQGMKNAGTIQAGDLYATDDLLVAGDAEVIGTLYVGILNAGANITSGHLTEDTTIDAGVDITAASGDGAFDYSLATGVFKTATGTNTIGGATVFAANKGVTVAAGTSAFDFSGGTGVFKTSTGAVTIGPGAITISGAPTVATGKTLAVTDADKLTVGGLIVPQTMIINVPIAAASVDQNIFIPTDSWEVINVTEVHTVAGNDADPVNLTIVKCTGTDAPSAGDAMLNAPIDLKGTANTIAAGELLTGSGMCKINDTERLAIDCSGTLTTLAGGVVTIELKRV